MSQQLPSDIARQVGEEFLDKPFGVVRFWGFAVVRPHDQAFEITAAQVDGDRLDLMLRHASHEGHASVLSVWSPDGVTISAQGLAIARAARLVMDDSEAWSEEPDRYVVRTPRGQGGFDRLDRPALTLQV
jgi:hypothetical protein